MECLVAFYIEAILLPSKLECYSISSGNLCCDLTIPPVNIEYTMKY